MSLTFRRRIFAWLVVIAVVPAAIATVVRLYAPDIAAPLGGVAAWERAGATWREAQRALADPRVSPAARRALRQHGDELSLSLRRARQAQAIRAAFSGILAAVAVALAVLVSGGAIRLAAAGATVVGVVVGVVNTLAVTVDNERLVARRTVRHRAVLTDPEDDMGHFALGPAADVKQIAGP